MKKIVGLFASSALFTGFALTAANAQTFGDIFTDIRSSQLGPFADLVGTISFVVGIVFAVMGVMAMIRRGRSQNGEGIETGKILGLCFASFCMIAIPTFANVGVASFFGTGANQSTIDGQLRSLN